MKKLLFVVAVLMSVMQLNASLEDENSAQKLLRRGITQVNLTWVQHAIHCGANVKRKIDDQNPLVLFFNVISGPLNACSSKMIVLDILIRAGACITIKEFENLSTVSKVLLQKFWDAHLNPEDQAAGILCVQARRNGLLMRTMFELLDHEVGLFGGKWIVDETEGQDADKINDMLVIQQYLYALISQKEMMHRSAQAWHADLVQTTMAETDKI